MVPESTLPPGLSPIATETAPVCCVATLSNWSNAVTRTGGAMGSPAAVLVGSTVKPRWCAAAGVTSNGALVAAGRPVDDAVRS